MLISESCFLSIVPTPQFTRFSVVKYVGHFRVFAVSNRAAEHACVGLLVPTCAFLGECRREHAATFTRCHHVVSQVFSGCSPTELSSCLGARQGLEGWDPGRSILTSGRGRCRERVGSGLPQLGVIWALVAGLEGEGGAQGGEGTPLHSLPV